LWVEWRIGCILFWHVPGDKVVRS